MVFEAEFYTSGHLIRGHVDSLHERLSDVLNLKHETALLVRDVQIYRLITLAKAAPLNVPEVRLEKHLIMMACPMPGELSIRSVYRRASRMIYRVIVLLPHFELTGTVHVSEKFETRKALLSRPEDFIPLTDASAVYSLYPAVHFQRSPIIFNKAYMLMLGELSGSGLVDEKNNH